MQKKETEYNKVDNILTDLIINKRCKHAILENIRTEKAFNALSKGDLKLFGQLLNESHYSLRDDYEVSGRELDVLTEAARTFKGVLGSRMTGAGFGGCAIALIPSNNIEEFKQSVANTYFKETGLKVGFILANIKDGTRVLA